MLPQYSDNPYRNILEAGSIRSEASRLEMKAGMLENTAQAQLDHDESRSNLTIRMPGAILCVAHGGGSDGLATFVDAGNFNDSIRLMGTGTVSAPNVIGGVPQFELYSPALIFQIGGMAAAAVIVPKDTVRNFQTEVGKRSHQSKGALAIAKASVLGIGFNSEMAYGIVDAASKAFASNTSPMEIAMVMQLGQQG